MRKERHGHTGAWGKSPTYSSWAGMLARCFQPSNRAFKYYQARGITVCDRWKSFPNFLADMGIKPIEANTIDRINNDGNYEPGNCRWATRQQQANNRVTNVRFEYKGESLTFAELVRATGVSKELLKSRLLRGKGGPWTVEAALSTPPRKGHRTDKIGPMSG